MNRTQKGAWFSLVITLILILFAILLFTEIALFKSFFYNFHRFVALFIVGLILLSIIFLRKKQSQVEVESDERDKLITSRAVLVSFVATLILLAAVCIIPRFIVGLDGSIPVWILSIINFVIFLLAFFIYSVAILIQYSRGGIDERK